MAALFVATACGANVEAGLFFPWNPDGPVLSGIVQGVLVEDDRCLFVEANGQRTLVLWEAGLGFEEGALLDPAGQPIARLGELIHGGGGYHGGRAHFEDLAGEAVPERCIPEGNGDRFAISYGVEAGPFECQARSQSTASFVWYVRIRSAPARRIDVSSSRTTRRSSSQPFCAAAFTIAYSPLT